MKALWIAALLQWPAAAFAAQQPERRTLAGDRVAVYNLAGVMRLERGTGSDVVVELTRGGRDPRKLQIATGPIRGRETLRIIYPDDEIVYRGVGRGSNTTLHVRDDGTFNDRHDRGGRWSDEGRRVRIAASGGGLEAHADARIAIPVGKRVEVYLAVGQAFASNVDGDLRVDVAAANVTVDHMKGSLLVDTGSGDVRLSDAQGDVSLDTGSGNVTVSGVSGPELKFDTGSGDVTASSVRAGNVKIDTGSGNVRLDLLTDLETLDVDTGSGDVTINVPPDLGAELDIETGSGDIDLQNVTVRTTRLERDHLTGAIGDGKGRIRIETGSGGVHLVRAK
ncbi:MAG TPA: DUF4097 family beta strand repeat-containing protein [bacterium]|nr:DUF4097 family beta strand repeat-containing protein [bacterium]